jgi:hypothetical protein
VIKDIGMIASHKKQTVKWMALLFLVNWIGCNSEVEKTEMLPEIVLKMIRSAQSGFCERRIKDINGNGIGEYGYLGELVKARGIEGYDLPPWKIEMNILREEVVVRSKGKWIETEYNFVVFLPESMMKGRKEGKDGSISKRAILQERYIVSYGWPRDRPNQGILCRAFVFFNGVIYQSRGMSEYYGDYNGPKWNSAYHDSDGDGEVTWKDEIDLGKWEKSLRQ